MAKYRIFSCSSAVEQTPVKRKVTGSNPVGRANLKLRNHERIGESKKELIQETKDYIEERLTYWKYSGKGEVMRVAGFTSMVQHKEFEKGKFKHMELYRRIEKEIVRIKQRI